jgi:hypothetical protein
MNEHGVSHGEMHWKSLPCLKLAYIPMLVGFVLIPYRPVSRLRHVGKHILASRCPDRGRAGFKSSITRSFPMDNHIKNILKHIKTAYCHFLPVNLPIELTIFSKTAWLFPVRHPGIDAWSRPPNVVGFGALERSSPWGYHGLLGDPGHELWLVMGCNGHIAMIMNSDIMEPNNGYKV